MKFKIKNRSEAVRASVPPPLVQPRALGLKRPQVAPVAIPTPPPRKLPALRFPQTRLDTRWATEALFTRDRGWMRLGEHA